MGVIHGAVRSSTWIDSPWRLEDATGKLNGLLCERTSRERFATMFWSYFDPQTRFLYYVNAGHLPPLLFRKGAETPVRLSNGGPILGLLPDAGFEQGAIRFEVGDVLVLYSDGVVEAENPAGEQFGQERVAEAVTRSLEKTADEIRDHILASLRAFTGQTQLEDDGTLLVVRHQNTAARQIAKARSQLGPQLLAQSLDSVFLGMRRGGGSRQGAALADLAANWQQG